MAGSRERWEGASRDCSLSSGLFLKDWDNPKENLAQPPAPSSLFHSEKFDSLSTAAAHAALLQPLLTLFLLLYCQPSFFSCHSLSPASADPLHLVTPTLLSLCLSVTLPHSPDDCGCSAGCLSCVCVRADNK